VRVEAEVEFPSAARLESLDNVGEESDSSFVCLRADFYGGVWSSYVVL
jgi:hypothetical protein